MERKTLFFVMLLFGILGMNAQELKLSATQKGKIGYRNDAGEVVIAEVYDYAEPFAANGLAKVGKGKKYGLIDKAGNIVLPIKYDEIDPFNPKNPTRIKAGKSYGLIDSQTGAILLEPKYAYVSRFNCYGLAWVKKGGTLVKGKMGIGSFFGGNANAQFYGKGAVIGGKMGIIDKSGTWRIEPKKYTSLVEFSNTTGMMGDVEGLEFKPHNVRDTLVTDCQFLGFTRYEFNLEIISFGLVDGNGNELVEKKEYWLVSKPVNGQIRWWKKNGSKLSYGYLNLETGEESETGRLSSDYAKSMIKDIKKSNRATWMQKKKTRKEVVYANPRWLNSTHGDFYGSIAPVLKVNGTDTTWCFVDRQGREVRSGYKRVRISIGDDDQNVYYACELPDRYCILTSNNEELFADKVIKDVDLPDPNFGDEQDFALSISDKWGVFSRDGNTLIEPQYDSLFSSRFGLYAAKVNGKWGFLDRQGQVLVPLSYDACFFPGDYNAPAVWVTEKTGNTETVYNYNIEKQELSSNGYTDFTQFSDGMAWAVPCNGNETDGYLIDANDNRLISRPFPLQYFEAAKQAILRSDGKPLSAHESNKLVLKMARGIQKYPIGEVVPAEGWDY